MGGNSSSGFYMVTLIILALIMDTICQPPSNPFTEATGDDIVATMQTLGAKCPAKADNGQDWAPLPKGSPCGGVPRCDFPNQWCTFKMGSEGTPDMNSLKCQPLKPDCIQAFKDLAALTSPPPGAPTTPLGPTPPMPPQEATGSTPALPTGETPPSLPPTPPTIPTMASEGSPSTVAPGGDTSAVSGPTPAASGDCCDYHEFCCYWASQGQCDSNKPFMVPICQKSCGTCGCSDPSNCTITVDTPCSTRSAMPPGPGPACPCTSTHLVNRDWHSQCVAWSANGGCDKNPTYMKPMCKTTCHVCT